MEQKKNDMIVEMVEKLRQMDNSSFSNLLGIMDD